MLIVYILYLSLLQPSYDIIRYSERKNSNTFLSSLPAEFSCPQQHNPSSSFPLVLNGFIAEVIKLVVKAYNLFWAHGLFFYNNFFYSNLNSLQFTRNVLRSVSLPACVNVSSGSTLWRSKPCFSKDSGMLASCLMELQLQGQTDGLLLPLEKTTCFCALVLTSFKISKQSVLPNSYCYWK